MPIECNEINQNINYLRNSFQDCSKLKSEDMQRLLDIMVAINTCSNGGPNYDTLITATYEPEIDEIITIEPNDFHSISLLVVQGQGIYNNVTLTAGTSINLEFTTTNQYAFIFTAKAGSKILVSKIIETII